MGKTNTDVKDLQTDTVSPVGVMIFLPMIRKSSKMSKIPTQLLGVAVLGCAIWVLVDKPGFLDLFEQVHSVQCSMFILKTSNPGRINVTQP